MAAARVLVGKVAGGAFPAGSVVWRLVAANNCTLGRAVRPSSSVDAGLHDVRYLCNRLREAQVRLHDDPRGWRWTLDVAGVTVAAGARPAPSRRDALAAARNFTDLLPGALAQPPRGLPVQRAHVDLTPGRVVAS